MFLIYPIFQIVPSIFIRIILGQWGSTRQGQSERSDFVCMYYVNDPLMSSIPFFFGHRKQFIDLYRLVRQISLYKHKVFNIGIIAAQSYVSLIFIILNFSIY